MFNQLTNVNSFFFTTIIYCTTGVLRLRIMSGNISKAIFSKRKVVKTPSKNHFKDKLLSFHLHILKQSIDFVDIEIYTDLAIT